MRFALYFHNQAIFQKFERRLSYKIIRQNVTGGSDFQWFLHHNYQVSLMLGREELEDQLTGMQQYTYLVKHGVESVAVYPWHSYIFLHNNWRTFLQWYTVIHHFLPLYLTWKSSRRWPILVTRQQSQLTQAIKGLIKAILTPCCFCITPLWVWQLFVIVTWGGG